MTPRDGALRADEVVASHSAADGAGPSIEGARTYAHGTSAGATAARLGLRLGSADLAGQTLAAAQTLPLRVKPLVKC